MAASTPSSNGIRLLLHNISMDDPDDEQHHTYHGGCLAVLTLAAATASFAGYSRSKTWIVFSAVRAIKRSSSEWETSATGIVKRSRDPAP